MGKLISATEYANRVGRDRSRILRKMNNGDFQTAIKIGNAWVIDEDEPYTDRRMTEGTITDQVMSIERVEYTRKPDLVNAIHADVMNGDEGNYIYRGRRIDLERGHVAFSLVIDGHHVDSIGIQEGCTKKSIAGMI